MKEKIKPGASTESGLKKVSVKWFLTIIAVMLVLMLEGYLFSKYSLWFSKPNVNASSTEKKEQDQSRHNPFFSAPPSKNEENRKFHPELSAPEREFHPIVKTREAPQDNSIPLEVGKNPDVVNPDSLALLNDASSSVFFRGVLEVETRNDLLLSPDREKRLLKACLKIEENWNDPIKKRESINDGKYLFFTGLNESQLQFVQTNMESWKTDFGQYKAPGSKDQELFLLEQCIALLSERVKNTIE